MDKNKGNGSNKARKDNVGSKIPKSSKSFPSKEKNSKSTEGKETAQNWKKAKKVCELQSITTSLKEKQINNVQKTVKPMSIAKISKEVKNQLETENVKSNDKTTECTSRIAPLDNENSPKRALSKVKYPQNAEKQTGSLEKMPSKSDFKRCTAHGGLRLTAKNKNCYKSDIFQKVVKEPKKDLQIIKPPEPKPQEQKLTDSVKAVTNNKMEPLNKVTIVKSPNKADESTKETVEESNLKRCTEFTAFRFPPKFQSTPIRPDLFDKMLKASKHDDNEMYPTAVKETELTPNKNGEIIIKATNGKKIDSPCIAFAGIRLVKKRKPTFEKSDIFRGNGKKSVTDFPASKASEISTEEIKLSSDAISQTSVKTKLIHTEIEKVGLPPTEKESSSNTVSNTMKKTNLIASSGTPLAPKFKGTPLRLDIFESIQKEPKIGDMESHAAEIKKIQGASNPLISEEAQHLNVEKLYVPTKGKPESSTNDRTKNMKQVIPKPVHAFGGLRFKVKQKRLHDIFETQKTKVVDRKKS